MREIIERQTFVISVNLNNLTPSEIICPMNLRFAADTMILKSLCYQAVTATPDTDNVVQIWCSVINDGLITSFPNNSVTNRICNDMFSISNSFQSGNIKFQFQKTTAYVAPLYYLPQPLISDPTAPVNVTKGILSFVLEFVKHGK